MGVPGSTNALLLTTSSAYNIERSVRFNSSDSAYLSRTPASAGNRKTWTWAGWVKRSNFDTTNVLLGVGTGTVDAFDFSADSLRVYFNNTSSGIIKTTAVFRDPSSWYHVVLSVDTTQATDSNRVKIFVNGTQVTSFSSSTWPGQNYESSINNNVANYIGDRGAGTQPFSGYLADIHFIDGQALTPSSFGEFDTNGVWQPKAFSGSYGTNGFRLPFSDNSAATATTLGKDTSGNGNNFTPNNLSVTAGSGNDSLVDSPTNYGADTGAGGEVRGNYCTWSPLYAPALATSNGNLEVTINTTTAYGTMSLSSGKWYWEITVSDPAPANTYVGVMDSTYIDTGSSWSSQARAYRDSGERYNGSSSAYGATYTTNDVIGVALDLDAGTLSFYKNGVSQGTAFNTGLTGKEWRPFVYSGGASSTQIANFGQRPFAYTAPAGFKALCTQNLPTPTIANGATAMDVKLYTGNGSTQTISGLNFSPDLVWIKERNNIASHCIFDSVRGTGKVLLSNLTNEEVTTTALSAFNSDGFSLLTPNTGGYAVGDLNDTYVAWCWDAGSSTVTNTQGSISSQVRANASAGFSIITFTMPTVTTATIGHGLNVAPALYFWKDRDSADSWYTYHSALGAGKYLALNSTGAEINNTIIWNNTAPTSSVINTGNTFSNTGSTVVYAFAPVAGYSSFGSYTPNDSANGPFVYTGFRPRWVMIKASGGDGNWWVFDAARDTYNVARYYLLADSSGAEADNTTAIDFLSNGFKIRTTSAGLNLSTRLSYVYAAFAEHPFQASRAR